MRSEFPMRWIDLANPQRIGMSMNSNDVGSMDLPKLAATNGRVTAEFNTTFQTWLASSNDERPTWFTYGNDWRESPNGMAKGANSQTSSANCW